jgi:hypothetical protein
MPSPTFRAAPVRAPAVGIYTSSIAFTSSRPLHEAAFKGMPKKSADCQGFCERVVPRAACRWGIRVADALCWRRLAGRP